MTQPETNAPPVAPPPVIESTPVGLTPEQKKGRIILASAFGFWLFVALCIDALIVIGNFRSLPIVCVRLAGTLGLFFLVWVGQRWARWLTVGCAIIAFLMAGAKFAQRPIVLYFLFAGVFLMVGFIFVFVLVFSKHVDAFLRHQQSRRK